MSQEELKGAGGPPESVGDTQPENTTQTEPSQSASGTKDSVAYSTYSKTVGEVKKLKEQLREYEESQRQAEEQKLREKEDYKTLLEQRENELNDYRSKYESLDRQVSDSKKLSAFLGAINGTVDRKYWGVVNLDEIQIDPRTGEVDPASLENVAKDFESKYPEVIQRQAGHRLPSTATYTPSGDGESKDYLLMSAKDIAKLPNDERVAAMVARAKSAS